MCAHMGVCTCVHDCEISHLASPQHSSPRGTGEALTFTGELGRMNQALWLMGGLPGASTASEMGDICLPNLAPS